MLKKALIHNKSTWRTKLAADIAASPHKKSLPPWKKKKEEARLVAEAEMRAKAHAAKMEAHAKAMRAKAALSASRADVDEKAARADSQLAKYKLKVRQSVNFSIYF